jgi:hypothetical protein
VIGGINRNQGGAGRRVGRAGDCQRGRIIRHPAIGPCHQLSTDITGLTRFEYLCPTDFDEPFALTDEAARQPAATWYTIVGTPHESPTTWRLGLASITTLAALLFARLWRRRPEG